MWVLIDNKYSKEFKFGYAEFETVDRDDGDEWISAMYCITEDNELVIYFQYEFDEEDLSEVKKCLKEELKEYHIYED